MQQALEIQKKIYQGPHPTLANDLNSMGIVLIGLGKYDEALDFLNQSYEMKLKLYPKDHIEIAQSLSSIGQVCLFQKRFSEAKDYLKPTFEIYIKHAPIDHPLVKMVLGGLIETLEQLGEADEANKYRNYKK